MLIRSQDKKSLINMDNVTDLSVVNCSEIMACYTTDQGYRCIGKYSDKAKVIKVLDMIQEFYNRYKYDVEMSDTFQMPQDEEI